MTSEYSKEATAAAMACDRAYELPRADRSLCDRAYELPPADRSLPPNPKQAYGDLKLPLHLVPSTMILYAALAFQEGARKYGPFNWRERAVEAMTYVGALKRHTEAWIDGEDIDPESGKPHLALALACLGILVDSIEVKNLIDNRPPKGPAGPFLREHTTR